MDLLKYTSYVTGKKVLVEVDMTESGLSYNFQTEGTLTDNERILIEQEAIKNGKAAANSKILLG